MIPQINQLQTNINYRKKNEPSFKGMFKMIPKGISFDMLSNIGENYSKNDKFLKLPDAENNVIYFICENKDDVKLLNELGEYPYAGRTKVVMNNVDLYNNKYKSKYAKTLKYIKTFFNDSI